MLKVCVTFLPAKGSDDVPYMDIHNFPVHPSLNDFIRFGGHETQTYQVVQVVHNNAKNEEDDTFCVTVTPAQLPHAAILKSEESRDNRPSV